ncbi:MAG TPA: amidohydrolase family protein [Pyrinomonadaceae bacterium]|nr:amidohydrolase family protein [Pyrinomonadaceae bacterium]
MTQINYRGPSSKGLSIWLCAFLFLIAYQTTAHAQTTAVRAARMLDVVSGKIVTDAVVLIENGRISKVGSQLSIPSGIEVIDLGNVTLLPGLIDCHTHLLMDFDLETGDEEANTLLVVSRMSTAKRALHGVMMGREMLEAGFTTVRDVGNSGLNGDRALRDAIAEGWVVGPRMIVTTRPLAPIGAQFGPLTPEIQKIIDQEYAVVSGVDEARRAVRQAVYDGAIWIKIIVDQSGRSLSAEEVKAIVDEAHRLNRRVAAHAIEDEAVRIAVEAGVDSVEHAYNASDEVLKLMAEKKIVLVPTDGPLESFENPEQGTPQQREARKKTLIAQVEDNKDRLSRALKAGVKVVFGSDVYYHLPGKTRGQISLLTFRTYVDSGMSPLDSIRAATINAGELLRYSDLIGAIKPGAFADIIAVTGDPLSDIKTLENTVFVMRGGKIIKQVLPKQTSRYTNAK